MYFCTHYFNALFKSFPFPPLPPGKGGDFSQEICPGIGAGNLFAILCINLQKYNIKQQKSTPEVEIFHSNCPQGGGIFRNFLHTSVNPNPPGVGTGKIWTTQQQILFSVLHNYVWLSFANSVTCDLFN